MRWSVFVIKQQDAALLKIHLSYLSSYQNCLNSGEQLFRRTAGLKNSFQQFCEQCVREVQKKFCFLTSISIYIRGSLAAIKPSETLKKIVFKESKFLQQNNWSVLRSVFYLWRDTKNRGILQTLASNFRYKMYLKFDVKRSEKTIFL